MAINAAVEYDARDSASNDNGGGFKSGAIGTDYSQQDAPQWDLTNISSSGDGLTITDADGNGYFTDNAAVGNLVNIAATGTFTAGRYEILTVASTDSFTIDRSAGASKSGGTGKVGGALVLLTDAILETSVPGNTWWVMSGTYTATTDNLIAIDGGANTRIKIKGYTATHGDSTTGTDRPLFALGTRFFQLDNNWDWWNFRATASGTPASIIKIDSASSIKNAKVEFTTAGGLLGGVELGAPNASIINSEVTAPNASDTGSGLIFSIQTGVSVIGNYVHDCTGLGIYVGSSGTVAFNTVDTCTNGIKLDDDAIAINNTVYNCSGNAIEVTADGVRVWNNDINTCGVGLEGNGSADVRNDFNNMFNNTTNYGTGVSAGLGATTEDPEYANAAGASFQNSLLSANGMPTYGNGVKQGAWQTSVATVQTAYSSVT